MKVEWMNHTGFVVSDMERSLDFYRDLLGLQEERNHILVQGYHPVFDHSLVGYPNAGNCTSSTWTCWGCEAFCRAEGASLSTHRGAVSSLPTATASELLTWES